MKPRFLLNLPTFNLTQCWWQKFSLTSEIKSKEILSLCAVRSQGGEGTECRGVHANTVICYSEPGWPLTSAWGPKISQGVFRFLPHHTMKVEERVEGVIQTDLGISQTTSF